MSQIPMVATMRQTYAGRSLKSGDEFNAKDEGDAADLVAIRFATRKPGRATIAQPPAPVVVTRVTESASEGTEAAGRLPTEEEEKQDAPEASKSGSNTQPKYPHRAMNSRR